MQNKWHEKAVPKGEMPGVKSFEGGMELGNGALAVCVRSWAAHVLTDRHIYIHMIVVHATFPGCGFY